MDEEFYAPEFLSHIETQNLKLRSGRILECIRVVVEGKEYRKAIESGNKMMSSHKTGSAFAKGHINTPKDQRKSARLGRLGEIALAKILHTTVDVRYLEHGDKHDFKINGITYDVKTSRLLQFENSFIKVSNDFGKLYKVPLKCQCYVADHFLHEDISLETATVLIIGYNYRDEIKDQKPDLSPADGGLHYNYWLHYEKLNPILPLCVQRLQELNVYFEIIRNKYPCLSTQTSSSKRAPNSKKSLNLFATL